MAKHVGADAQVALVDEVARGAYQLEPFGAADVKAAGEVIKRFAGLRIDILTLDERHFRALRIGERKRFRLLPADANG